VFISLGVEESVPLISVRFVGFVDFIREKISINSVTDCIQGPPFFFNIRWHKYFENLN
jgi:hypothetical protein